MHSQLTPLTMCHGLPGKGRQGFTNLRQLDSCEVYLATSILQCERFNVNTINKTTNSEYQFQQRP